MAHATGRVQYPDIKSELILDQINLIFYKFNSIQSNLQRSGIIEQQAKPRNKPSSQ